MTRYRYTGPPAAATLRGPDGDREIRFHPGQTYELPDSAYVATLVALGHLVALPPEPAPEPAEPALPAWKDPA